MNPVQQKIQCVYKTGVLDEPSSKRQHQQFRVAATRELNGSNLEDRISSARATEKIDGTCCLVAEFQGIPWLWARHDRKPSKVGERRFGQYRRTKAKLLQGGNFGTDTGTSNKPFEWDPAKDFKEVPNHWMPALRLMVKDGVVMPDDIGHTPGWVPVQRQSRQHCWHLEAVDLLAGTALVLRESDQTTKGLNDLVIDSVPLSDLVNQTCELIGTNINGNPYGLGSKKNPVHVLVAHGAISLVCPDPREFDAMWDWMTLTPGQPEEEGGSAAGTGVTNQVEGIVWHCGNGQMYKLHRHHLNLKWPDGEPSLCRRRVHVSVRVVDYGDSDAPHSPSSQDDQRDDVGDLPLTNGGNDDQDGEAVVVNHQHHHPHNNNCNKQKEEAQTPGSDHNTSSSNSNGNGNGNNSHTLMTRMACLNGQSFPSLKSLADCLAHHV